jgi:hypothetical protein
LPSFPRNFDICGPLFAIFHEKTVKKSQKTAKKAEKSGQKAEKKHSRIGGFGARFLFGFFAFSKTK